MVTHKRRTGAVTCSCLPAFINTCDCVHLLGAAHMSQYFGLLYSHGVEALSAFRLSMDKWHMCPCIHVYSVEVVQGKRTGQWIVPWWSEVERLSGLACGRECCANSVPGTLLLATEIRDAALNIYVYYRFIIVEAFNTGTENFHPRIVWYNNAPMSKYYCCRIFKGPWHSIMLKRDKSLPYSRQGLNVDLQERCLQ